MRGNLVRAAVAPLLGVLLIVAAGCGGDSTTTPRYSFEFEVVPSSNGAYETTAVVRDLASGEVVLRPRILSLPGQPATVTAADPATGLDYKISVEIEADEGAATYLAEIADSGGVLVTQRARLQLRS